MQFPKVSSNTFNGIDPPKMPNGFFKPQLIGTLFSFFLITILSTLIALFLERIKNYEEKKQIQFEKTAAELSALKLQISPHFLFNTLNNIRWLARKKSDLTEDAIVKLATLLRYIIYQANEQKVALVLEINNLKDFIGLQEMRIGNNTSVSFEVSGLVEDYEIEPLLFIPFVENAFKYGVSESDLVPYMAPSNESLDANGTEIHFYGYYKKWVPQENYYYCVDNTGFEANPVRNEGTYSKYASLDDKIDGFHYYLAYIKFGLGRCTSDTAHEIRDGHITREEGVALVRKFDGEFPAKYFETFLEYCDITEQYFNEVVDSWRSEHLWEKDQDGKWSLKSTVQNED
jgi:hypothetical protein